MLNNTQFWLCCTVPVEAVLRSYSVKKVFLKFHRKTPAPESFFKIKLEAWNCIKEETDAGVFL